MHMSGHSLDRVSDRAIMKHAWQQPDTRQQERCIALYLLIWGESANLRFMPELLFFLFAIANAHCAHQETLPPERRAAPKPFLDAIVRPIYACVFTETFSALNKNGRPMPKAQDEMPVHLQNDIVQKLFVLDRHVMYM